MNKSMSLEITVAVPFKQHGEQTLSPGEFVVALAVDREWFSPDQAQRLIDIAEGKKLLVRDDRGIHAQFDHTSVSIPESFEPSESIFRDQSAFEQILQILETTSESKQSIVAAINERQQQLGITVETAAAVYACERDISTDKVRQLARQELEKNDGERYT
jgi:hypothetical protein